MGGEGLRVSLAPDPEREGHVLRAKGEIDMSTVPILAEAIAGAMSRDVARVVLDLGEVTFIDSSGLRTLVEGLKAARVADRAFVIRAPSQPVLRLLRLTRLDQELQIEGID